MPGAGLGQYLANRDTSTRNDVSAEGGGSPSHNASISRSRHTRRRLQGEPDQQRTLLAGRDKHRTVVADHLERSEHADHYRHDDEPNRSPSSRRERPT